MPSSSSTMRILSFIDVSQNLGGRLWEGTRTDVAVRTLSARTSAELDHLAGLQEDDVLGHVGHPVPAPLQVVGALYQGDGANRVLSAGRLASHVLDQIVEDAVVEAIDLVVLGRHLLSDGRILLDQGVQDVSHLLAREVARDAEPSPEG